MTRKAFVIQAKPGMAEEYEKRHNPIWPALSETLRLHGVRNYSIFLHASTDMLFGYMEVEDEEKFRLIAESDVCQRWWSYMKEVLVSDSDESPKAKEDILREVFHLD
jgi:L-rhamnose mutarotase